MIPLRKVKKLSFVWFLNHANPALEMIVPEVHSILRGCYQWIGPRRSTGGWGKGRPSAWLLRNKFSVKEGEGQISEISLLKKYLPLIITLRILLTQHGMSSWLCLWLMVLLYDVQKGLLAILKRTQETGGVCTTTPLLLGGGLLSWNVPCFVSYY